MTTNAVEPWVDALRAAAKGSAQSGVETLRGARPGLLDASSANTLSSLALATFVTAAAVFRMQTVGISSGAASQFDLIASALRTLAVAFMVRAAIAGVRTIRTLLADTGAAHATLALSRSGLLLKLPNGESWTARSDVLAVTFQESLPSRTLTPRAPDVLLVLSPQAGRPRVLSIPPYFAPS